ncbi:MAG: speA [Gammaproteobacteria bacterium]|jgi:arginine decarboxylase|nr:speA [Gammaproteobacteria bacterium]
MSHPPDESHAAPEAKVSGAMISSELQQQLRETYNIAHWSSGYFDIGDKGNIVVYPDKTRRNVMVDMDELLETIYQSGLPAPVLIRFNDILKQRFEELYQSFSKAIKEFNYQGSFTGVYPIKVNQQRRVVHQIVQYGKDRIGLEAGSKPELLAVLAHPPSTASTIVCNGYKDREYIRLALIGQALGHKVYIIIEKISEVQLILEEAKKIGLRPLLGVRVRLSSTGTGKWQDSGGEKSKFGFSANYLLKIIEKLQAADYIDTLQILHFHLGSQIANINDIQRALRECARYYVELRAMSVPIHTVDVGGGLGIDYEGTHSRSECSMNYSIQEYANNIIYTIGEFCNERNVPHPNIITESGRAMTAHHAVLVMNIIDVERAMVDDAIQEIPADAPKLIQDLWYGLQHVTEYSALETYHDACHLISEVHSQYIYGIVNLKQRALGEQIYLLTCTKVRELLKYSVRAHREAIDELNEKLADKIFGNFSLFQSLPDAWAINQIFPILPVNGLTEKPSKRGVLQDITCDSDGKVDNYVDSQGVESTLPLMPFNKEKPYYLGIFLVGAYQEILGDMHNLFGDTNSVHVELTENGGYQLVQPVEGDTVADVLRYVHFDASELLQSYRSQLAQAALTNQQRQAYLEELRNGLQGYTYLED